MFIAFNAHNIIILTGEQYFSVEDYEVFGLAT